jgi:heme/copper-type cytochrome/quinol oxidase subunit 1
MVTSLHSPHIQSDEDLMRVWRLLGWRAGEYDGRIHRGTIPLTDLRPGEMVLFTSYALVGFMLPVPSFFLTLLETYGLQHHHLTPHALTLVAVFVHLCEMYVGVRPSVRLFRLFFVLWTTGRSSVHLGAYYFKHRGKSSATYISPFAPANGTAGGMIG